MAGGWSRAPVAGCDTLHALIPTRPHLPVGVLLAGLAACAAEPPATCEAAAGITVQPQDNNLLRFTLTAAEAATPGARFRVWEADGEPEEGWDVEPDAEGTATVHGLVFETEYGVRVDTPTATGGVNEGGDVGCFTTLPAPPVFPRARVSGRASVPFTLVNLRQRYTAEEMMLLVDDAGRVRWYEEISTLTGNPEDVFDGYTWDPATQSVWALLGHEGLVQYGLDGTVRTRWEPGLLQHLASHDVLPRDGRVYVPVTDSFVTDDGTRVLRDGYEVYTEAGERVHSWFLDDHGFTLADDPPPEDLRTDDYWSDDFGTDAIDWTHVNSLDVSGEGADEVVYLSLRNLSQVVAVSGTTGEILWRLGDNGAGGVHSAGDFVLDAESAPTGWFFSQHEFIARANGGFQLYDNGDGEENTRALGFTLDHEARTVHYDTVIDLGRSCSRSRGASYALEGGNVLTTCGDRALVQEFAPDGVEQWSLRFDCGSNETGCVLYRAIPVAGL